MKAHLSKKNTDHRKSLKTSITTFILGIFSFYAKNIDLLLLKLLP